MSVESNMHMHILLWFCFSLLCEWLAKLAPLCPPTRSQHKPSMTCVARTHFLALDAALLNKSTATFYGL